MILFGGCCNLSPNAQRNLRGPKEAKMSKSEEIILTAWSNSSSDKPNGFSILKEDRDDLFKRLKSRLDQNGVIIEFPSGESLQLSLDKKPTFWSTCPEFISSKIGAWIKDQGDPWPYRKPPKYTAKLSTAGAGAIKIKILGKQ